MLISTQQLTGTAATGSFSVNTAGLRGIIRQVIVEPTTSTTIYTITIVNSSGIDIFETTSETGTLCELTSLPVRGIQTITISDTTADEAFTIELMLQE